MIKLCRMNLPVFRSFARDDAAGVQADLQRRLPAVGQAVEVPAVFPGEQRRHQQVGGKDPGQVR